MNAHVRTWAGALIVSGLALAASPFRPAAPLAPQTDAPPPGPPVQPGHIVNVHWEGTLKGGATQSVLRVPAQFHLIVTRAYLRSNKGQRAGRVVEDLFGAQENKWESEMEVRTSSGIGPVFRPESELVLRNTSSTDDFALDLIGYYAPATSWPPVPVDSIVTEFRTVTIGAGNEAVLLEVPRDRWLTLTKSTSSLYVLVEDLHGSRTDKPVSIWSDPDSFLQVFRPGSLVKLRNDTGGTQSLPVQMIGYFTDALAEY